MDKLIEIISALVIYGLGILFGFGVKYSLLLAILFYIYNELGKINTNLEKQQDERYKNNRRQSRS